MTTTNRRFRSNGHLMRLVSRFYFAHEPGDTPAQRAMLERFEHMGFELGAAVTVWECRLCAQTTADFQYESEDIDADRTG